MNPRTTAGVRSRSLKARGTCKHGFQGRDEANLERARDLYRLSFKEHRTACFSRVALFGTKQRVTSYTCERKRGRDSNTGSNPVGATTELALIN
jgi:hypothetical protein